MRISALRATQAVQGLSIKVMGVLSETSDSGAGRYDCSGAGSVCLCCQISKCWCSLQGPDTGLDNRYQRYGDDKPAG